MITLDEGLASRMDEMIRRTTNCDAASDFPSGSLQERSPDYGAAICGAQGIIGQAVPDGPFADFRLIQAPQIPFKAGDLARAASVVASFARDYRFLLKLKPEAATALGHAAFALAVNVLIDNIDLGPENPV